MKKIIYIISLILIIQSCNSDLGTSGTIVEGVDQLQEALDNAAPGDDIVLKDGVWKDVEIDFNSQGEEGKPITLRAETPGSVSIEGQSRLRIGGTHLEVSGLHFKNGYTPGKAVIIFKIDDDQIANHCRVTNCVIENFNQPKRDRADHWVEFWGRYNQLDHCYIAGKTNQGPTVRVSIRGNENIKNFHKVTNNHFGPRPRKGGPRGETIQIGDSYTSMSPSNMLVANNLFERCNGEVEVISSKTNFNEFRNNVFYKCEGSLVTRHGNYCIIDGNYFIGDDNSDNIGGIRLINTGHWVTNNYFYNLKGKIFRSPLAVMNGIPKSPLNRYNQVTDVVVAYNTWVNCESPLQFGVGSNISEKDVLPLSEIRSARPTRTIVANNVIFNEKGDKEVVVAHDKIDGIQFESNLINNQGVDFGKFDGLTSSTFEMKSIADGIYAPTAALSDVEVYKGFDFETIEHDLFGQSRSDANTVGAISQTSPADPSILDKTKYGASWFTQPDTQGKGKEWKITNTDGELSKQLAAAAEGDLILLSPGTYRISTPLPINKKITLQSADKNSKAQIMYTGAKQSPAFQMQPYGNLILNDVKLSGNGSQFAFSSLKENMAGPYNLSVTNCEINAFDFVLKAYKESFADEITFTETVLSDCENGIELSEETNDKGDYNVEFLTIDRCVFKRINKNVIDYYRGGYDESTIGGNLLVTNSTFTNSGKKEKNNILINTRGIINVDLSNNTFENNPVKLIALLWGAKNNSHSGNTIKNSGKLIVEENLKLKLLY